jgi:hypothetical protein
MGGLHFGDESPSRPLVEEMEEFSVFYASSALITDAVNRCGQ